MDLAKVEERVRRVIGTMESAELDEYFWGKRSGLGDSLPPYYLVYFLLVDLLKFKNRGVDEKISFSIPVRIDGTVVIIEHRKLGLDIFIKSDDDIEQAKTVLRHICAGVKAATNFFDSLADNAAKTSNLNVNNNANSLYDRFCYFLELYKQKLDEVAAGQESKLEVDSEFKSDNFFSLLQSTFEQSNKIIELRREAMWLATSAIESFFNWTEHVFILIAILKGEIKNGNDVADKVGKEWGKKFKLAIDINSSSLKLFYDRLLILRKQVRNFVAHGAFGKDGQALEFHSSVGAVPLLLPHRENKERFKFGNGVHFLAPEAMQLINDFLENLWQGELSPAKIYIESGCPLILSYVTNGTYAEAMKSERNMDLFVNYLTREMDNAANMDW
ncbi:TPA: hypothetical protein ACNAHY_004081 [Klebsiella pneumoniae]